MTSARGWHACLSAHCPARCLLRLQAAVELLQAAFQVHPPAKGKLPCHSLSLSRQQLSDDVRLEYQVEVAARYALGTANGSTAAPPANGFAPAAAAAAAAGRGDGGGAAPTNGRALPQWQQQQQQPVGQQHLQNGRYQRHGEQPARLAGGQCLQGVTADRWSARQEFMSHRTMSSRLSC